MPRAEPVITATLPCRSVIDFPRYFVSGATESG
jgi:hypothetical protein